MPHPLSSKKLNGKTLTIKQAKWWRELIKTGQPTEAAWRVYDCKDRGIARNIACENMAKLHISRTELLEKMGLDEEKDTQDLIALREANTIKHFVIDGEIIREVVDDSATRIKALELTHKLKGNLSRDTGDGIGASQVKVVVIYPPGIKKESTPIARNTKALPSRVSSVD